MTGDRVRFTGDSSWMIQPGDIGTIVRIDAAGLVHVSFDIGWSKACEPDELVAAP